MDKQVEGENESTRPESGPRRKTSFRRATGKAEQLRQLAAIMVPLGLAVLIAMPIISRSADQQARNTISNICISTLVSVLVLWILDAGSVLIFRYQWLSKAIWAIAVASILGTSAAVFKNALGPDNSYPLQGTWVLEIKVNERVFRSEFLVVYAQSRQQYVGTTLGRQALGDSGDKTWIGAIQLLGYDPGSGTAHFQYWPQEQDEVSDKRDFILRKEGTSYVGSSGEERLTLTPL